LRITRECEAVKETGQSRRAGRAEESVREGNGKDGILNFCEGRSGKGESETVEKGFVPKSGSGTLTVR
jgi:hypothetical protein